MVDDRIVLHAGGGLLLRNAQITGICR
jgi:hypothetical protein